MKLLTVAFLFLILMPFTGRTEKVPEHFKHVDQVIWVVDDLTKVIEKMERTGF